MQKTKDSLPQKDRRQHAKAIAQHFDKTRWSVASDAFFKKVKSKDAVQIAVMATATLTEIKRLNMWELPNSPDIVEVLRMLQPSWIEDWVAYLITGSPHMVPRLAPIWNAGLCPRPTQDEYIIAYFAEAYPAMQIDEYFLEHGVWRFFEIEAEGFSLTSYVGGRGLTDPDTWWQKLLAYQLNGQLDRDRLLDATLDALERGFKPHTASWFIKFHSVLEPSLDELHIRNTRYIRLLGASNTATIAMSVSSLQKLQKAGMASPSEIVPALENALQARTKATVTSAMRLLSALVKQDPQVRSTAAHVVKHALINERSELQEKALDLVEAFGGTTDNAVREALAEYAPFVAKSVQIRIAALVGADDTDVQQPLSKQASAKTVATKPVADADEALAEILAILEDPNDPFRLERTIDGISRFGVALRAAPEMLSPLKNRARQLSTKNDERYFFLALTIFARSLSEDLEWWEKILSAIGQERYVPDISTKPFVSLFINRNAAVLERVKAGHCLPLLALPSNTSGCVSPDDLVSRLAEYRKSGVDPCPIDLQMAMLRLSGDGRSEAVDRLSDETEPNRAILYALGADIFPGKDRDLWAAAWAARQPVTTDKRISSLFKKELPDCGVPAEMVLSLRREENDEGFVWLIVRVPVTQLKKVAQTQAIPALFYTVNPKAFYNAGAMDGNFDEIAWVSLLRPGWQEPFFRQALITFEPGQTLSKPFGLAFLEPFFRPGISPGPFAWASLAYFMIADDKAVVAMTIDAIVEMLSTGKLDANTFSDGLRPFLMVNAAPTDRWTKGLDRVAKLGAREFVRDVLTQLIQFAPNETPRNMGGMLELLYELHLSTSTVPTCQETLDCLREIPGGGKVAKFSKNLLKLAK